MKKQKIIVLSVLLSGIFPVVIGIFAHFHMSAISAPHRPLYGAIEALGGFALTTLGCVLILLARRKDSVHRLLLAASGLIFMGAANLFKAVLAPGETTLWLSLYGNLGCGLFFILACTPDRWIPDRPRLIIPIFAVVSSIIVGALIIESRTRLPNLVIGGGFLDSVTILSLLGGLMFLTASLRFIESYLSKGNSADALLINISMLFCALCVLLPFTSMWRPGWWFLQFLSVAVSTLALTYLFAVHERSGRQLEAMRRNLENLEEKGATELSEAHERLLMEVRQRKETEKALKRERAQLLSIFDSINEIIYVSDPITNRLLYMNKFGEDLVEGSAEGQLCYKALQGLNEPCEFCTNSVILELDGQPYRWRYYNPKFHRNYQITDRIITWPDGRKVRFELAFDITEQALIQDRLQREGALLDEINSILMTTLECETSGEVAGACLKSAEKLTQSPFGWIGLINDKGLLDTMALGDPGWDDFTIGGRDPASIIKDMEKRGVWAGVMENGKTEIINLPQDHPEAVDPNNGHPELRCLLASPLKRLGKTIGVIALANKPGEYKEADARSVEALCAIFVDALDRKTTEEQLKKHKHHLEELVQERTRLMEKEKNFSESALESLPGIFYMFYEHGGFIRWNKNFETVTGLSHEQMKKANLLEFFEGQDRSLVLRMIQTVFESGYAMVEARLRTKGDLKVSYLLTGKRLQLDGGQGLVGMGIDISGRMEAEEEASRFNSQLKERVKELQCLYSIARLAEQYSSLDEIFRRALEIIPRGWQYPETTCARIVVNATEFRDPNYTPPVSSQLEDINVNSVKAGFIEVGYKKEMEKLDEGPFLKEERDLIQAIADRLAGVIERSEANDALQRHATALERANAELEQFTYISSHHMQEPLRRIINFAELLQERYKGILDEDADRYMGYMVSGALRMRELIEELLIFTRLDKTEPNRVPTDLNPLVNEVVSDLEQELMESKATLNIDDLPIVDADPTEMKKVFKRLLDNAIKYGSDHPPQIHISWCGHEDKWLFSVRDNGLGIDPEYCERVFQVFQRLHSSEEYSGTGMGLALCRKIVQRHGGWIWVESIEGEGSIFHFTIDKQQ